MSTTTSIYMLRFILLISLLPLFSFKCITNQMRQDTITVTNKLPIGVYIILNFDYPDSTLSFTSKQHILANDSFYFIPPLQAKKLFYMNLCNRKTWKKLMKTDTLQVYVFDEKDIKEKSWDAINKEKVYLGKLTFHYSSIIKDSCSLVIE